ncbi:putative protein kinase RLK-Pelle-RLCK-VIIa-2 family [Rosa chinensis]|uniref:Protein kinase domain-containing protein n=1 Tax=Rosa chinensis TaxID=74649 RepID=A0A2P6P9B7_ROSCH|nr:putative protein kinase RLK-Pelle-RLCK-VIIa-2 family [Rosa chinensis]
MGSGRAKTFFFYFSGRQGRASFKNQGPGPPMGPGPYGLFRAGPSRAFLDGQGRAHYIYMSYYFGHKEWLAEVQFLGVVNHPNLVKLLGYCSVDGERGIQRLLVYEYMPNRSLEDHLFSRALNPLPWITRLQIMLVAAQGLAYLHEGWKSSYIYWWTLSLQQLSIILMYFVIYQDFKSSNVLLDEDFKPKLSDFRLAREGPKGDRTHVSTAVVGTYGYAALEYVETGHLSIHSDLWSFGVVLYEILTGRRVLERHRPIAE